MEVRQLRYFVAVAEELHFGRAAEREHIVQSALSQQIRLLEREIGVRLLDRNTHQVALTRAGAAFLEEARLLLVRLIRATVIAQRAASEPHVFRVATTDSSYELMPPILEQVQAVDPEVEVHQLEAVVSQQYEMLSSGELDVGIGFASLAPENIASRVYREDPLGVLVSKGHRLADERRIRVSDLEGESLLFGPTGWVPEYDHLIQQMCREAGFSPTPYRGRVQSLNAGVTLVRTADCALCTPMSDWRASQGVRWIPLVDPSVVYPWSLLWRVDDNSPLVDRFIATARRLATARQLATAPLLASA
jgi:DNA-binding transcriptional LysR family regulator